MVHRRDIRRASTSFSVDRQATSWMCGRGAQKRQRYRYCRCALSCATLCTSVIFGCDPYTEAPIGVGGGPRWPSRGDEGGLFDRREHHDGLIRPDLRAATPRSGWFRPVLVTLTPRKGSPGPNPCPDPAAKRPTRVPMGRLAGVQHPDPGV